MIDERDLHCILVAIMLSGYTGGGGFNDEQLELAVEDAQRIIERVSLGPQRKGAEPGSGK